MTDPDIASPRRSYGSSWIALLVAGLVVVLVVIGLVLFSNGGGAEMPDRTALSVDIDLPRPHMPRLLPLSPPAMPPEPAPTN